MGKVRRLISAFRRGDFALAVGGTFVAIVGLGSALLGIVDKHFGVPTALAVFFGALLVSAALNYRSLISPQVSVDDLISPETFEDPFTRIHCPCSYSLAQEAKRLADDCFSGSISIGPDTFEQFRLKNPLILSCLTDHSGRFLGYFDAIPLAASVAEALLKGTVTEAQITHEDVLAEKEMNHCKFLFISGFAVVKPYSYAGKRHASMLAWALLQYLQRYYQASGPLVFALAATRSGDEILQRFKLPLTDSDRGRRDRYRLYSVPLSARELERRLSCVPDWRMICTLDWAPAPEKRRARRPALPKAQLRDLA